MESQLVDLLRERFSRRREVALWRGVAAFFVFIAFVAFSFNLSNQSDTDSRVVRYNIDQEIMNARDYEQDLIEILNDETIKALIIGINTPGGGVAASEALFDSIKKIAESRPVVSVMYDIATSGGYMAALGSDWIIARNNTITASIGAVAINLELSELLEKIGISVELERSGILKAAPDYFTDPSEEAVEHRKNLIFAIQTYFMDLVRSHRDISDVDAELLSDGRVVLGKTAKDMNLIDEIGGESEAVAWLENNGIDSGINIVDWHENDDSLDRVLQELYGMYTKVISLFSGTLVTL